MKKRYMIKIVGSADGNHFESAYRRKHLNYYCVVIKQNPKFYKIVLFHKFLERNDCPSFRVAYKQFKKACQEQRKLRKSLKEVINYLANDYAERNNDMMLERRIK